MRSGIILLVAGLLFVNINSNAQKNAGLNNAKLDSFITALETNNKAMGSVALSDNGKLAYNKAWGYKSVKGDQKVVSDPSTRFRIGSISKMFTAVMILQLAEEGKLELSTNLSEFFPEIPNATIITVEQLLNHHSGLHNFTADEDYQSWMVQPKTKQELLTLFAIQKPDFEAGERAEYSNTNYVLLGFIIEKLTSKTYAEVLKTRIVNKIGLPNTAYGGKIDVTKNEAASYLFDGTSWEEMPETDMSVPHGAGAIVSTPSDLIKFIEALFSYKLINKASLANMMTMSDGYGLGLFRMPFGDKWAYGHNGGIDGFSSMLTYFPEDKLAFAYVSNGGSYPINDAAIGVLSICFNKPYAIPTFATLKLPEEKLIRFEGTYVSEQLPLKITIKKEGDHLTAQATGQGAFPLDAASEYEFKFDPANIVMVFGKVEPGKAPKFVLKQGGGQFEYTRE